MRGTCAGGEPSPEASEPSSEASLASWYSMAESRSSARRAPGGEGLEPLVEPVHAVLDALEPLRDERRRRVRLDIGRRRDVERTQRGLRACSPLAGPERA